MASLSENELLEIRDMFECVSLSLPEEKEGQTSNKYMTGIFHMSSVSGPSAVVGGRRYLDTSLMILRLWDQGQAGVRKTYSNHCRENKKRLSQRRSFCLCISTEHSLNFSRLGT